MELKAVREESNCDGTCVGYRPLERFWRAHTEAARMPPDTAVRPQILEMFIDTLERVLLSFIFPREDATGDGDRPRDALPEEDILVLTILLAVGAFLEFAGCMFGANIELSADPWVVSAWKRSSGRC